MKNDIAKVPYIGVEYERFRYRRIIKLLAAFLAIAVFCGVVSNLAWKIKLDKATEGDSMYKEVPEVICIVSSTDNAVIRKKNRRCGKTLMNLTFHAVSG